MLDLSKIYVQMEKKLSQVRFVHSKGVAACAVKLAVNYGEDPTKAEIAGILHDCAKEVPIQQMKDLLISFGYGTAPGDDLRLLGIGNLMHSILGAHLAEKQFGVTDRDILSAIKFHTTAKENMSMSEKIIYVADYIEPNRISEQCREARVLAYENIDKAVILRLNFTLQQLIDKRAYIHPDTVAARNYFIQNEELFC